MFNDVYQPLRHRIFAHKDIKTLSKRDELWAATKVSNIEDLLNFLHDLKLTLQGAYENGNELKLGGKTWSPDFYEKDFVGLMERIKI